MSMQFRVGKPIVDADLIHIYRMFCDAYEMAPSIEEEEQLLKWRTCIHGQGIKYDIPGRGTIIIVQNNKTLHVTTKAVEPVATNNPQERLHRGIEAYFWKDLSKSA